MLAADLDELKVSQKSVLSGRAHGVDDDHYADDDERLGGLLLPHLEDHPVDGVDHKRGRQNA